MDARSSEQLAVWCCSLCGAIYYTDFPRCPNDGGEVIISPTDPLLAQTVGRYVIERLIGEGGMGRVYLARHAQLADRRYAFKVLLGDAAATASMRLRFAREAEATRRLVHANIVGVIDHGETPAGLPYLVMDYVDGRPLLDVLRGGMEPVRTLRLARAMCEGLAHAHAAGIVHRDLKPSNVLVELRDGHEIPRIVDFGLAQATDPNEPRLTSTGMAMGTPAYAPPEQLAGRRVDHRADLYALGMTMFEMLTGGTLPFEGAPLEAAGAKVRAEAPRIDAVAPDRAVPEAVQALVARLLRRHPDARPASAIAVIAAIDEVLDDLTGAGRTTIRDAEAPRRTAQVADDLRIGRRRLSYAFAAVVVGATATAVWSVGGGGRAGSAAAIASAEPPTVLVASASPTVPTVPPPAPEPSPAPPVPAARPAVALTAPAHVTRAHSHDSRTSAHAAAHRPASRVAAAAPKAAAPLIPEPAPLPPPPPPPPAALAARIAGVDVHGSLPAGVVRRAVDRVAPAVRRCIASAPQTVDVRFTIDESRRAQHIESPSTCVANAVGGVRTEVAPDVGDVEVAIHIVYETPP